MRILLDEALPVELRAEIPGRDVRYVRELGWSGLKNGELLARAAALFDVLLTADQNLEHQQNLKTLPIAVIILVARSNRVEQLRPLLSELQQVLSSLQPCSLVRVEVQA
jgi:predicted nuclease of predicted toxin-antitoxin system